MGSGGGTPDKIGGISGQGGGRKMPAVATSIGEFIAPASGTRSSSSATLVPGKPDIRPLKPLGSLYDTAWTGQGGGGGQAGTGSDLTIYWHLNSSDQSQSEVYPVSGGGGGWGAAGGPGANYGGDFSTQRAANLGAAGGKAIKTNGHAVTWLSGSSRAYGAIG